MGRAEKGTFLKHLRKVTAVEGGLHLLGTAYYQAESLINQQPSLVPKNLESGLIPWVITGMAGWFGASEAQRRTKKTKQESLVFGLEFTGAVFTNRGVNLTLASLLLGEQRGVVAGTLISLSGLTMLAAGEKLRQDGYLFRLNTSKSGV